MKNFSFAYYNVRSLVKSFADFKNFVLEQKYDFIGICETWLSPNILDDLVNIQGYSFVRCDRCSRGGGVGLYIKSGYKFSVLNRPLNNAVEQVWVKVTISSKTYITQYDKI